MRQLAPATQPEAPTADPTPVAKRSARTRPVSAAGERWPWAWMLGCMLLLVPVGVIGAALDSRGTPMLNVATVLWLTWTLSLVAATSALFLQFHLTRLVEAGWLTALLLPVTAHAMSAPPPFVERPGGDSVMVLSDLLVPLTLLLLWAVSRQVSVRRGLHPLVIGVAGVGVVLAARRVPLSPETMTEPVVLALVVVYLTAIVVASVHWTLSIRTFPARTRTALLPTVATAVLATQFPYGTIADDLVLPVAVVLISSATVLLVVLTLSLTQWGIHRHRRTATSLKDRTLRAERMLWRSDTLLRELRSSLEDLSNASHLLSDDPQSLTEQRALLLRELVNEELQHLEHLVQRPAEIMPAGGLATEPEDGHYDLDRVLREAVASLGTAADGVSVQGSGLTGYGHAVTTAQDVHDLLGLVLHHEPAAEVVITSRPGNTTMEVLVTVYGQHARFLATDSGPDAGGADASRAPRTPLLLLQEDLRLRGGDMRWGPTPDGATFTLACRR